MQTNIFGYSADDGGDDDTRDQRWTNLQTNIFRYIQIFSRKHFGEFCYFVVSWCTVKVAVKEVELKMEVIMIPKIKDGKTCRQIYSDIQCKTFGKFRQPLQTFGNIWLLLPTDDNLWKLVPKFGKHTATFAFFLSTFAIC